VALLALLVTPAILALQTGQQTDRAKKLSMKMMCVCGCNQILGACNHVGCTYSHDMLRELDERVGRNESDDLTVQAFVQEYGAAVMLLPEATGFNRWMWIMPVVFPIAGIVLVRAALIRWRQKAAAAGAARPGVAAKFLDQARREAGGDDL